MLLNPAAPTMFLPVGLEVENDGPPATGVYVVQPSGCPGYVPARRYGSIRIIGGFWTRTTPRPPRGDAE